MNIKLIQGNMVDGILDTVLTFEALQIMHPNDLNVRTV